MKLSIAALATSIFASLAAAGLYHHEVTVDLFNDTECLKGMRSVTLIYDKKCGGICNAQEIGFKSYRISSKAPKQPTFLFVTAFEGPGTAACFSQMFYNTTSNDGTHYCTQAARDNKRFTTESGSLRLEAYGP